MPMMPPPPFRLHLYPRLIARFPDYTALVIYAEGLTNGPSDAQSIAALRAAEQDQRAAFAGRKAADHPHIQAWRTTQPVPDGTGTDVLVSTEQMVVACSVEHIRREQGGGKILAIGLAKRDQCGLCLLKGDAGVRRERFHRLADQIAVLLPQQDPITLLQVEGIADGLGKGELNLLDTVA